MRESSIVIHKGGKEEKYQIYIEDYAMSFLKGETGTLELSEYYFYGLRENNMQFVIYGAGRDKNLTFFDNYSMLDEIGCRLTQAGPVFFVREESGTYEIKGYDIFYQDNKEMQNYLINRKKESDGSIRHGRANNTARGSDAHETRSRSKAPQNKTPYSAISIQLGIILMALVAIVINSTNSYDKMSQLNQSALEVFFAIENQEADRKSAADDPHQEEDALKLAELENEKQARETSGNEADETEEEEKAESDASAQDAEIIDTEAESITEKDAAHKEGTLDETAAQEDDRNADLDGQEGVDALSRNVARYYEIEKGDTLYTISRKIYGDTTYVQKICELNKIDNPDNIRYGQKIVLP